MKFSVFVLNEIMQIYNPLNHFWLGIEKIHLKSQQFNPKLFSCILLI